MKTWQGALAAALLVAVGAVVGWYFSRPQAVVETPAAEVKQADGSTVIERRPDSKAKPRHATPKGAKVERVIKIEAIGKGITLPSGEVKPCPPVTVDLSLVREQDGGKRVVASSPDGRIVQALDIPVETAAPPPEPKRWAAGLSADPVNRLPGVWVERDIGRVRLGAELNRVRATTWGPDGTEIRLKVGLTF